MEYGRYIPVTTLTQRKHTHNLPHNSDNSDTEVIITRCDDYTKDWLFVPGAVSFIYFFQGYFTGSDAIIHCMMASLTMKQSWRMQVTIAVTS